MNRIPQAVFVLFLLLATFAAAASDLPKDMLAAGRVDEAIATLNSRLSSTPRDAESANLLCRSYYAMEDWERAESACKKAVSLDANNARYYLWLGRVYGEKADRAGFLSAASLVGKVRDEFQRAVQLDPRDVEMRLDLAEFYIEAPGIVGGGTDKAREQARTIGATNPGREHWIYARIAEKKENPAMAEREYRQFIELSHSDAEAWLNLALFMRRRKRLDEMEQALIKASESPMPKPDVLVESAGMLYRVGRNFPLAIQLVQRYLSSGPVEAAPAFKAHYLLGMLLEKQGDKAGASQQYRASLALSRNYGQAQQALNRVAH
jgi:tetratricopeptide (TPR) repeat protein